MASNCWAVAGKHTESGKPILTCDPHLFKFTSVQWYFMHNKWEDNYQIGGVIPGMLHFSYSRTKANAYGITSMNADSIDIYVEQVKDGKYLFEGEWYPLKEKKEKFLVRGFGWREHTYYYTHNGVLMEPQQGEAKKAHIFFDPVVLDRKEGQTRLYSLRWSMLEYDLENYDVPFNYEKTLAATSGEEFIRYSKKGSQVSGPLNQIFVTSNGDIGYIPYLAAAKRRYATG